MKALAFAAALLLTAHGANAKAADGAMASSSPFRYDDDVSEYADRKDLFGQLKHVSLGDGYASFGADLRERLETSDVALLGFRSRNAQTYDLHRLLLFADLHPENNVRLFIQIGSHLEAGRERTAPTDVDRLDLAQAFVDFSQSIGAGRLTVRLGRAEMSFDDGALIGLRDGPNVRQSWDGARISYADRILRLDVFAVRPVAIHEGIFDDASANGQSLQGAHASVDPSKALGFDLFWYHSVKPGVAVLGSSGRTQTNTVGAKLRFATGPYDGSLGVISQTGVVGPDHVRSFALHADLGRRFSKLNLSPHLSFRADVLSGGSPQSKYIGTFDALYPNVSYSTEATIEAPANLVQVGLVGKVTPTRRLEVQYTLEKLWRYSSQDAFYAAPLTALVLPDGTGDRSLGVEQQLSVRWRASDFVTLHAALVRFDAGSFIKRAGGSNETFCTVSLALRL